MGAAVRVIRGGLGRFRFYRPIENLGRLSKRCVRAGPHGGRRPASGAHTPVQAIKATEANNRGGRGEAVTVALKAKPA